MVVSSFNFLLLVCGASRSRLHSNHKAHTHVPLTLVRLAGTDNSLAEEGSGEIGKKRLVRAEQRLHTVTRKRDGKEMKFLQLRSKSGKKTPPTSVLEKDDGEPVLE